MPFLKPRHNLKLHKNKNESAVSSIPFWFSEIDAKYKAKIAEKKIFLEKSISEAMQSGAEETVQKLRQQVAEEITSLGQNAKKRAFTNKNNTFYLKSI